MAYAKTKTAVAVAIIALVPLVSQWQRNRELGGRLTDLESRLDLGAGNQEEESSAGSPATLVTKRSLVGRSAGHDREGTDARKGVVFADWRDALLQADPLKRNQALAQLVAELSPGGATEALEAFMQVRREGGDFGQEMRLFMRAWGGIDGEAAVREALQDRHGDNSEQVKLAQSVLGGWAAEDPQAALAWIESRESGAQTEALALGLIDGWSVADFASAAAFAESRPRSAQRDRFIELLLRRAILSGGVPAAQSWFAGIAADEHNQVYREHAFNGVVQAMLYRDPAEAAAWIAANSDQPFVGADAVRTAADSLALKSPRSAMDWVDSLSGLGDDARRQGVGRVFDRWAMNDLNGAGEWLASNQDHGEYDRLAAKFAMRVRGEDVEAAKAWIESISNDGIRDELLAKLEQTHSFTWRLGGENVAVGFSDGAGGAGGEPVELALTPFHIRASQDLGLEASGIGGDFGLGGLVVEEDPFSASEVSYDAFITDSSKRSSHPPITGAASCTQCHRH